MSKESSLADAYDQWRLARATLKDSPNTQQAHRSDVEAIASRIAGPDADPWLDVTVSRLDKDNLRRAFADYADAHAVASIARVHSSWSTFTKFLVREEWLTADPMLSIPKPKVPRPAPKPLKPVTVGGSTEETAARLIAYLMGDERAGRYPWAALDRAVLTTLLFTGLRASELCSLRINDLAGSPGERRLAVVGKGSKHRSVPLEPSLEAILTEYQDSRQARFGVPAPTDLFFVSRSNTPLQPHTLRYMVTTTCRAAGVGDAIPRGAVSHALRATFATLLAQNGASASELADLLGHESITTAQHYVDVSTRETRMAARSNPLYRRIAPR